MTNELWSSIVFLSGQRAWSIIAQVTKNISKLYWWWPDLCILWVNDNPFSRKLDHYITLEPVSKLGSHEFKMSITKFSLYWAKQESIIFKITYPTFRFWCHWNQNPYHYCIFAAVMNTTLPLLEDSYHVPHPASAFRLPFSK